MTIIHRYSCGCIGIPIPNEEKCLLLWECDQTSHYNVGDEYSFGFRAMPGKTSVPLPEIGQDKVVETIATLIHDGYRMQNLASAIKSINNRK